jgi:hypothetical protein
MSWIALDEVLRLRTQDIDLQKSGYDIRTIQELLGHNDVRTTMIYTHVLNRGGRGIKSPVQCLWAKTTYFARKACRGGRL